MEDTELGLKVKVHNLRGRERPTEAEHRRCDDHRRRRPCRRYDGTFISFIWYLIDYSFVWWFEYLAQFIIELIFLSLSIQFIHNRDLNIDLISWSLE